jgi:hypothetical protein
MKPKQPGLADIGIATAELLKILLANFDAAPAVLVILVD